MKAGPPARRSLEISARIGSTRLPIRAVLELGVGQVIELDRQVGAPIDIIANNDVVIARGEVVEVDDKYGVRITEVSPRSARLDGSFILLFGRTLVALA